MPGKRYQRGLAMLHQMVGYEQGELVRRTWESLAPDFAKYVLEFLAGEIWKRPHLDLRTRSLVTVAALTALGRSRGLELNIRMAVNNGATKEEVIETLLQMAPYAGFPACWEGIVIADQVFKSMDDPRVKPKGIRKRR
ncbi:MAG: carboxymuconolactone decarboxylase family protein [Deinococcus sp.]|nr:carboxymuconolactone decarboxylase family protein [Deinococcus sp.]